MLTFVELLAPYIAHCTRSNAMETGKVKAKKVKKVKPKRDIDNSILDRFWDLADASSEKRIKAADQLLTALAIKQSQVRARVPRCSGYGLKPSRPKRVKAGPAGGPKLDTSTSVAGY